MVVVDSDVKPIINRTQPRKIFKFTKADWTKVRQDTLCFTTDFMANFNQHSVHDNWSAFKHHVNTMLNKHVPAKTLNGNPTTTVVKTTAQETDQEL